MACVYDPLNELFTAQRGSGAQLNSARIRVKQVKDMQGAVLQRVSHSSKSNIQNLTLKSYLHYL